MPGAVFTDVDPFFDADEFGTAATWQSQSAGIAPVVGVVLIDAPGQMLFEGVMSTDWTATYRVADWPTAAAGDRLTIGTTIYEIRELRSVDDGLLARAALRRLN